MQNPSPFRLCVDCVHYRANEATTRLDNNLDRCAAPELVKVDLVRGEYSPVFCDVVRQPYGRCGPGGKFWQPHPDTFLATSQESSHVSEGEEDGNPSF